MAVMSFMRQERRISRKQFEGMVRIEAYHIWVGKVWRRRNRDWDGAHGEFASQIMDPIFHDDPRHPQVKIRAEQLWREWKESDAIGDWLAAEKRMSDIYTVAD